MYTFIVNPNARSGQGLQTWRSLEPILKKHDISYNVFLTRRHGHASEFVRELTAKDQEHTIIAVGGDGTVNEIINGIADYQKVTLGYIPIGSSNDFARGLSLTKDPVLALESILNGTYHIEEIDLGTLTIGDKTKHFGVSCGIGFDAAICHEAMVSKIKVFFNRFGLGKLTYAGIALHRILFDTPMRITVQLDDEEPLVFEEAYFVTGMNLPYEGGGFKFCPEADSQDGVLDILVIANISKLKILMLLPTAFFGWHIYFKGVHTFRCREASIRTAGPLPVHTDGEAVFLKRRIHLACDGEKLRIMLPGESEKVNTL